MKKIYTLFIAALVLSVGLSNAQLSGFKVSLDPGHGGTDSGAVGSDGSAYPNEEHTVLEGGLMLRDRLIAAGATVTMTRTTDWKPGITDRANHFTNENPDAAISIHLNSFISTSTGTESLYYHASALAKSIQPKLVEQMGFSDRGIKYRNDLGVLKCSSSVPVTLSEGCFISNPTEFNYVTSTTGKNNWVTGHEEGLYDFFGVDYSKAPSPVALYSVENTDAGLKVSWAANSESNLVGYKLYYAEALAPTTWKVAANQTTLTAALTSYTFASVANFTDAATGTNFHFKLVAVNTDALEGGESDTYAATFVSTTGKDRILIVDGFDRTGGSYTSTTHNFVTTYFNTLSAGAVASPVISSAANEQTTNITLSDYDMVVWFTGDESTIDESFSTTEQTTVQNYMNAGGKLFVSGSELGWDLVAKGATADQTFYTNYLKANYVADGSGNNNPATGITGTDFTGLSLNFGQVYTEDWPDEISAVSGGQAIFNFKNGANAGVAYNHTVVHISFPLETVSSTTELNAFAGALLSYLDVAQTVLVAAPVADFTASTSSVVKENTVTFTNASTNAVSYAWSFAGGTPATSTAANPTVTYATEGTYDVTLIATNSVGVTNTQTVSNMITVTEPAPVANFTADAAVILKGASVNFTNTSTNAVSYAWSFAGGTPATSTAANPTVTYATEGTYDVTLTASNASGSNDVYTVSGMITVTEMFSGTNSTPSICYLTTNTSTNKNVVVWEKEASLAIKEYNIYKESTIAGVFNLAGTVAYDQTPQFEDASSNPTAMASRYQISAVSLANTETALSAAHKSIHLTISAGMSGAWNLIWDNYEGFAYTTFKVYRGTAIDQLTEIAQVQNSFHSYTDVNAPTGAVYYAIAVDAPACSAKKSSVSGSFSNVVATSTTSLNNGLNAELKVYPNPAKNAIYVSFPANANQATIAVYTITGTLLSQQNAHTGANQVNINQLSKGMYIIKVQTENSTASKRFIKE